VLTIYFPNPCSVNSCSPEVPEEPGTSVSIVFGYGLDDRAIGVRSPAEARGFFLQPLGPYRLWGYTQPLVQLVPSVLFPGVKCDRGVTLTTHPHLVPKSGMSRSYTSSPSSAFVACSGTALALNIRRQQAGR
jgi:hypothetical protein